MISSMFRGSLKRRLFNAGAAVIVLAGIVPAASSTAWAGDAAPILASPAQAAAENLVLRLLADPEVKRAEASAEVQLAGTSRGQTAAGAARIPAAVDEWSTSVAFDVVALHQPEPAILWVTDDTPRTWLGHTLPGAGVSGDDPDNVYRLAFLDGGGTYEITGKIDQAHRPSQFSFEFDRGDLIIPQITLSKVKAGLGTQVAMVTDRDLAIAPDGTFHFTIGGDGPGHVTLGPGPYTMGLRDTLSDWSQRPNSLSIHRLDAAAPAQAVDYATLRGEVIAKLADFVSFWSTFPDKWFGGIAANSVGGPVPRDGGWGFVAGVHYKLEPGEALVVRTTDGQAQYTGFQVTDTWMIAPDAKRYQTSLNKSQAQPDADGSYTFVIAPQDPGTANWLDTAGQQEGYAVLRWQALPPGATKDGLVREVRVVRIADLTRLPGVRLVSPDERKATLLVRADGYAARTR